MVITYPTGRRNGHLAWCLGSEMSLRVKCSENKTQAPGHSPALPSADQALPRPPHPYTHTILAPLPLLVPGPETPNPGSPLSRLLLSIKVSTPMSSPQTNSS